jgi:2-C-methyl-D-erythritol 2,4-cyclodiphosphate synthase
VRIGFGYDSHRFVRGRKLMLGGVDIPHDMGLAGHSDADVLAHAVIDSIIGALGLGDIGTHFPDTDPGYKDADSMELLEHTLGMVANEGYQVSWIDCSVICEHPKLAPHMDAMHDRFEEAGIRELNIKAKTNEGMGPTGRGEGIVAYAVCLLNKIEGEGL